MVEESTPTPSSLAPTVSGSRYNSTSARSATSSFSTIGSAKTSQKQSATGNKQPTDTYPSRSRSISPTPMGSSIMQCMPVAAGTNSCPTGCNSCVVPAPQQRVRTNILLRDTNISSPSITPAISSATQRSTATSSTVAGRQHVINSSRTVRKRPVEALEENPTAIRLLHNELEKNGASVEMQNLAHSINESSILGCILIDSIIIS